MISRTVDLNTSKQAREIRGKPQGQGGNGEANDKKMMSTDKIENKTRPKR